MSLSPICTVQNGAGSPQSTVGGVNVTPGATITITLVSAAGVTVWTPSVYGTDELVATPTLTIDHVGNTATFTAPAAGSALLFSSNVYNAGTGENVADTFAVFTLLNGLRVGATNETLEGDATHGWTSKMNAAIRAAATGGEVDGTGTTTGATTVDIATYPIPDNSVVDVTTTFVAGDPAQPTKTWSQTRTVSVARTGGGSPVIDVVDTGASVRGTLSGPSAAEIVSGNNLIARGTGSVGGQVLNWRAGITPSVLAIVPSGGGGPTPILSFYADVPGSISAVGSAVSAWSAATSVTGTPTVTTDSIGGGQVIRTKTSDKLLTTAGAAEFLSSGPCTMIFVWRYRTDGTGGVVPLIDTTEGGTKAGIQVQIGDQGNNIVYGRSISIREWNGSSWSFDSTSIALSSGAFIPLKKQVISIRMTDTTLDIQVDGQSVKANGIAISRSYTAGTTGKLSIGGSTSDDFAIELYNSKLSDSNNTTRMATLASRFGVNMSLLIQGDPTFASSTNSGAFPWISKLPGGKLYATIYNGVDGVNNTDHNDAWLSADGGLSWTGPTVLTTSAGATKYSDIKTSEPLSDGSVIQTSMTYDLAFNFKNVIWRRATTFNVDGSPIWPGTWNDILTGTPTWSATDCAPVEDPTIPGTLHMAVFTLETGATFSSAYDYVSTNAGATWTRHLVADGQALSKQLTEPFLWFVSSEIRYHIRDNTTSTTPILATHSTDHGVTWAALSGVNLPGHSSAQQVRVLASGRTVCLLRRIGSSTKGAIFYQASGAAWNTNWSNTVIEYDALFGGMYYGGIYETSPGNLVLIASRTGGPGLNVASYQFPEWILDFAMPGVVTPATVALTIGTTRQLSVTGAGDFTYAVTTNNSGGSVSGTGLITAGAGNGIDTITVTDLNGHIVGTCVSTVTGASSVPTVTGAVPDFGTAAGGSSIIITGTNMTGATAVTIGGVTATITGNTSTSVTVTTGAKAASANNTISVTTPGGTGTKTNAYAYLPASFLWAQTADVTTLSGSNITTWNDISPNGRDLGPPGFSPTIVTGGSGINGQKAVLFAGSDQLDFASFPSPTALDFFIVAQNPDDGTTSVSPFGITSDSQQTFFPLSTFSRHIFDGCGSTTRQSNGVFAPTAGAWSSPWSYNAVSTSSEWTGFFNGTQFDTYASNTVGFSAHHIGRGNGGPDYIGGKIAFMIAWGAKLSTGDRAVVNAYIHTKYGI